MRARRRLIPAKRRSRSDPETHPQRGQSRLKPETPPIPQKCEAVSSRRRLNPQRARPSRNGDVSDPSKLGQSLKHCSSSGRVPGGPSPAPPALRTCSSRGKPAHSHAGSTPPAGPSTKGRPPPVGKAPLDDVPGHLGSGAKLQSSSALEVFRFDRPIRQVSRGGSFLKRFLPMAW